MKLPGKFFLVCLCLLFVFPFSIAYSLNNFLVITDIHLDQTSNHLMEINPSSVTKENDLDPVSFKRLLININKNILTGKLAAPNFVLVLGDMVGHLRTTTDKVIESESTVFKLLRMSFPNTPIFYTFGNNDSLPVNYGPFQDGSSTLSEKSPYDIAKKYGGWNDGFLSTGVWCHKGEQFPCLISENKTQGFYAAYIQQKFRYISLNSVAFSPRRQASKSQAAVQLGWLANQLESARRMEESVLISMHIPPGNNIYDHSNFWLPEEESVFLKIIKEYKDNIIGMLAGHTHVEELKIIRNASGDIISGIYFAPALSTSHGNAPAIKTFYYAKNNQQWALINYETYNFSVKNYMLALDKLYDFEHYYCEKINETIYNPRLQNCLNNVNVQKIKKYFTAGNPNMAGIINSPEDINLVVQ